MSSRNERGFTLLEIVVAVALLSFLALEGMQVFERIVSKSRDDAQRWKAQLALESVTDVIATFEKADLKAMVARDASVGGAVASFTSSTDPWIAKFEDARRLRSIRVRFRVFAPGGVAPVASLPPGWDPKDFDIEIETRLDYRRNEKLASGEELAWTKRIEHL